MSFGFLLIVRTGRVITAHPTQSDGVTGERVPPDARMFQHIARFTHGHFVGNRYSYGRRLPGLRFRASLRRANPSP
jgi:hypothetical protein